jgi:hypothetical protein
MPEERVYRRRPEFVAANVGDEMAVLDLAHGTYLGFNTTAAQVWRLLSEPRTLEGLCQAMTQDFDVDAERCRREIAELLDKLVADGMIEAGDGPVA